MNHLLLLFILLAASLSPAAEPLKTYEGEVAGIFCSACSSHVKEAVMKIEGVRSAKILSPQKDGLPRLRILSTKPVTVEQAAKALGEQGKMYSIRSLTLVKD